MVKYKNVPNKYLKILEVKSVDEIDSISEFKWKDISSKKELPQKFIDIFANKLN